DTDSARLSAAPPLSALATPPALSPGASATSLSVTPNEVVASAFSPPSLEGAATATVKLVCSALGGETSTSAPRLAAPAVHIPGATLSAPSPDSDHPVGTPVRVTRPSVSSPSNRVSDTESARLSAAPPLSALATPPALSPGASATSVTVTPNEVVATAVSPPSLEGAVTAIVKLVCSALEGETSVSAPRLAAPAVHIPGATLSAPSPDSDHPVGTPVRVTRPKVSSPSNRVSDTDSARLSAAPPLSALATPPALSPGASATSLSVTPNEVVATAVRPPSLEGAATATVKLVCSALGGETSTSAPRLAAPAVHTPGATLSAPSPDSDHPAGTPVRVTLPKVSSPSNRVSDTESARLSAAPPLSALATPPALSPGASATSASVTPNEVVATAVRPPSLEGAATAIVKLVCSALAGEISTSAPRLAAPAVHMPG